VEKAGKILQDYNIYPKHEKDGKEVESENRVPPFS